MYTQLLGALGLTICMVVKFTFPFIYVYKYHTPALCLTDPFYSFQH